MYFLKQTDVHTWLSPLRPAYMYVNSIWKLLYKATLSFGFYQLKPTCDCLCSLFYLTCMTSRWKSFSTYPRFWIMVLRDPTLFASTLEWNLFTQPVRSPHSCVSKSLSLLLHYPHYKNSFFSIPDLGLSPNVLTLISHQNLTLVDSNVFLLHCSLVFIIMSYNLFIISKVIDVWNYFSHSLKI